MFSCEFRAIFKNTFFIEHLWGLLLPLTKWHHVVTSLKDSNQTFADATPIHKKDMKKQKATKTN